MKTRKEAFTELCETFDDFYSPKLNESEENFVTLDEFEKHWIEVIREKYSNLRFANCNLDKMDILYISPSAVYELTKYCEINLFAEVMKHFATNASIVVTENNKNHPTRWWVITDYLKDDTIDCRKKLSVILSFAAIGGYVQIGDRMVRGDVDVLCTLKETNSISEEDYGFFVDAFFNISSGMDFKFKN